MCYALVITRQQAAVPIVIISARFIFFYYCRAGGGSGVRGRCTGCACCLVTLAGLCVHIGCVCVCVFKQTHRVTDRFSKRSCEKLKSFRWLAVAGESCCGTGRRRSWI